LTARSRREGRSRDRRMGATWRRVAADPHRRIFRCERGCSPTGPFVIATCHRGVSPRLAGRLLAFVRRASPCSEGGTPRQGMTMVPVHRKDAPSLAAHAPLVNVANGRHPRFTCVLFDGAERSLKTAEHVGAPKQHDGGKSRSTDNSVALDARPISHTPDSPRFGAPSCRRKPIRPLNSMVPCPARSIPLRCPSTTNGSMRSRPCGLAISRCECPGVTSGSPARLPTHLMKLSPPTSAWRSSLSASARLSAGTERSGNGSNSASRAAPGGRWRTLSTH
jgi:hypothetical protein